MKRRRLSLSPAACAVLAATLLAAGCADQGNGNATGATPGAIAPSTAMAADSPMPASEAIQSADFAMQAQRQGYQMTTRDGKVLYCWRDASIGSRITSTKCLDRAHLKVRIQQEERQRQAMQKGDAAPKCPIGISC